MMAILTLGSQDSSFSDINANDQTQFKGVTLQLGKMSRRTSLLRNGQPPGKVQSSFYDFHLRTILTPGF